MPWFFPSFLTPTFLVLGILAISLPVLFHFFRRTPRGNTRFSSLMFLQPSPPRLTRRSRVDNWLLLLLRGLILLFIALAFGRIFFRQNDLLNISDLPTRRVAILVDTSASMMRGDLWKQAQGQYLEVVQALGPRDDIGVFAFDRELKTIIGFDSSGNPSGLPKNQLVREALDDLRPTYGQTELGQALIDVLGELKMDQASDPEDQISASQVILISDLQAGSRVRSLASFDWPDAIPLEIKTVGDEQSDNAYLSLLDQSRGVVTDSKIRVKVTNVADSQRSEFELRWITPRDQDDAVAGTIVVPPGQSRVISLSMPDFEFDGLELFGDSDPFDNRYYLAYPETIPANIAFVGADQEIGNQLRFYLEKACAPLIGKRFRFTELPDSLDLDLNGTRPSAIFVTGMVPETQLPKLRGFMEQGGLVCVVTTDIKMQSVISGLVGEKITLTEPENLDYALLGKIDFNHRIFAPFSDPKYSNFSNIQFWKYRVLNSDRLKSLAEFDTGDMAIGYQVMGTGELYVLASGWHPADSQLALSTKFVGIMMSMMLKKLVQENRNLQLDDRITLSDFVPGEGCTLVKPDGNTVSLENLAQPTLLSEADVPGIYQLAFEEQSKRLALNLPASESRTSRLSAELLEQEGVLLGTMGDTSEKIEKERQRRDKELESRQKLWRWMLWLALATLIAETLLSAFFVRRQLQNDVVTQES